LKKLNRILFISSEFPPGPGGIGNHAWNLVKQLNKDCEVDILTVSEYATKAECNSFDIEQKLNIYRFERSSSSIFTYIKRLLVVYRYSTKNNYTYCIFSGKSSIMLASIINLIQKNTKLIGVVHGSELLIQNPLVNFIFYRGLNRLNLIISVSKHTQSLVSKKILDSKKKVIPNGVNLDMLKNKSDQLSNIRLKGKPCLITIGSITERKGQESFITILPQIIKKYPDVHYHCIGLPIEGGKLKELLAKNKLDNYVTIHGFIPNRKLYEIYQQADILILLSKNNLKANTEGFGIVVLEANLFGVPSIGSIRTGISESIKDGDTGFLVDPSSAKNIISSIARIMDNKNEFSKKTIEWAQKHSWEKITKRYIEAISDA
tara:strand:- start:2782 stop:3906 length:1125 start_codon:yes stop_codon:yes gene_type:complete